MRPFLPVLIATAALAAVPTPALAKGVTDARVCGARGCDAVERASLRAVIPDGGPTDPPAAAAPFVTVRVTFQEGPHGATHAERFTYLPGLGLLRFDGAPQWIRLYPDGRSALDRLVSATEPYPASQLDGIAQPARPVPDADDGPWWPLAGAAAAALALLALLARYATSALKARPRASKSAN